MIQHYFPDSIPIFWLFAFPLKQTVKQVFKFKLLIWKTILENAGKEWETEIGKEDSRYQMY